MSTTVNPLLELTPEDAALHVVSSLDPLHELLAAAMTSKFVLLATATKVLHRKRPALIPIMDSVVAGHYVHDDPTEKALLQRSWESRSAAADIGRLTIARLRDDVLDGFAVLDQLQDSLEAEGYALSHVWVMDILVWTERELAGSYRTI
jgi:hypothetical protein